MTEGVRRVHPLSSQWWGLGAAWGRRCGCVSPREVQVTNQHYSRGRDGDGCDQPSGCVLLSLVDGLNAVVRVAIHLVAI